MSNNQSAGGAPPNNQAGPAGLNNTPRVYARYTGDELPALLSSLSIGEASSGGEEARPQPTAGAKPRGTAMGGFGGGGSGNAGGSDQNEWVPSCYLPFLPTAFT